MGRIVCFDSASQRHYQDRIDAADDLEAQIDLEEGVQLAEIRLAVLAGMNSARAAAPILCTRFGTGPSAKIATEPLIDVITEALDAAPVAEILVRVLAESTCPHVAALKVAIADYVATDRARLIAQVMVQP